MIGLIPVFGTPSVGLIAILGFVGVYRHLASFLFIPKPCAQAGFVTVSEILPIFLSPGRTGRLTPCHKPKVSQQAIAFRYGFRTSMRGHETAQEQFVCGENHDVQMAQKGV